MKSVVCAVSVVVLASCGNSSGGGEVKVFHSRAELAQAMREGKIKKGDRVALKEGNLDDVPGVRDTGRTITVRN